MYDNKTWFFFKQLFWRTLWKNLLLSIYWNVINLIEHWLIMILPHHEKCVPCMSEPKGLLPEYIISYYISQHCKTVSHIIITCSPWTITDFIAYNCESGHRASDGRRKLNNQRSISGDIGSYSEWFRLLDPQ